MTDASTRGAKARVVLLTGFEPFAGEALNPSGEIVRVLDGEDIAAHRIVGAILPVSFSAAPPRMDALIAAHDPALVLALGQAGGREGISLERVAVNLIDARIPDNAGVQPVDACIVDNAANAYFSTLPIKAMLQRLRDADIPASLSQTAGTFVCNQVFYALMHALRRRRSRGGFVHVPYLPEQAARHAGAPSLPFETMIEAVRLCLDVALTKAADAHYAAGSLD